MAKDYLEQLNMQQRAAVEYKDGPALVIAGAGSGKTRVLTYKIVDLLENGYDASRILALTFTNKAAREMKERIEAIVDPSISRRLWMGTFHSIFLRILHTYHELIGYKANFTIYDTSDSKSLIKMIIKDMELDDKKYKVSTLLNVISKAKNRMVDAEEYLADKKRRFADEKSGRPMTGHIYLKYSERCRLANAMDFDDILYYMNVLLADNDDIRKYFQDYFQYILVDEYQDTNFAQHLIIRQLAEGKGKLCVVGDDAQSIYSFRGANLHNILNLEKSFPGLRQFKLERNYRSTQNIVNAAGSLIKKNVHQLEKDVYSENEVGKKVAILRAYSDYEEGYRVASLISSSKNLHHDSYEDYAILYRTNAQSRIFEEALRKKYIPYRIYGGMSFYQRKEVKDAICYFRMAVNPGDDESLRRIINFPARKIGETTVKKAFNAANEAGVSMWDVICSPDDYDVKYNATTKRALAGFVEIIRAINAMVEEGRDAFEVAQIVYNRSGMLSQFAHDSTPEEVNRMENLRELLTAVKEFVDQRKEQGNPHVQMTDFLGDVQLATDQDEQDGSPEEKVTMMTVHAAKGLEFKHVYIVGLEEELFPSAMAERPEDIEEERRLLYVAITRAMTTCTITYAGSRFRNGQTSITKPSRFLREIDPRYVSVSRDCDLHDSDYGMPGFTNPLQNYWQSFKAERPKPRQEPVFHVFSRPAPVPQTPVGADYSNVKFSVHDPSELTVGMNILHSAFGKGRIIEIAYDDNACIIVDFGSMGTKKLMLRFAKFQIL